MMTDGSSSKNRLSDLQDSDLATDYFHMAIKQEVSSRFDDLEIKEEPLDLSHEDYGCKTDSEFEYDNESNDSESDNELNPRLLIPKKEVVEEEENGRELRDTAPPGASLKTTDLAVLLREQTQFMKNLMKLLQWKKLRNKKEEEPVQDNKNSSCTLLRKLLEQNTPEASWQQQQQKLLQEMAFGLEGKRKMDDSGVETNCKRMRVKREVGEASSNYPTVKEEEVEVNDHVASADDNENTDAESLSYLFTHPPDSVYFGENIQKVLAFFMHYPANMFNSIWSLILNNHGAAQAANSGLKTTSDYEMIRQSSYITNSASSYECNIKNSQDVIASIQHALTSGNLLKSNVAHQALGALFKPDTLFHQPTLSKESMSNHGLSPGLFPEMFDMSKLNNGLIPQIFASLSNSGVAGKANVNNGLNPGSFPSQKTGKLKSKNLSQVTEKESTDDIYVSDSELKSLSVRDFNRRIGIYPSEVQTMLRKRRRTLKNRGYASSCRAKRQFYKQKLEDANDKLRSQIKLFRSKLNEVKQDDSYSVSEWVESLKKEADGSALEKGKSIKEDDEGPEETEEEQQTVDLQYRKQLEKFFPVKDGMLDSNSPDGGLTNYFNLILRARAGVTPNVAVDPNSGTITDYSLPMSRVTLDKTPSLPNASGANSGSCSNDNIASYDYDNKMLTQNNFLTDGDLLLLSVPELNKRIRTLPKELQQILKHRRRTLKNRHYAKNCRTRRMIHKERLEIINTGLKMELNMYKQKLKQLGLEMAEPDLDPGNRMRNERIDYSNGLSVKELIIKRMSLGGRDLSLEELEKYYSTSDHLSSSENEVLNREKTVFRKMKDASNKREDERDSESDEEPFSEDESLSDWEENGCEQQDINLVSPNIVTSMLRAAFEQQAKTSLLKNNFSG